ncbi:uncharacterized protein si:ch73-213k20.5 isoform X2 [Danio rerio]|uniref:Uncharacterized protein si:ch73-213k20.5 isoform X2 n=1 Tax=Danio rerio TaxID=7955 RepID=A0A8M6Z3M0_DANRE|nr:uncharacterized protein si:ch73-213k20.5 isoform X1 [Danio rerio]|eukprot:XP_017208962.1 uncharacterized protein si:ch73-213k20.5 isoform X1 [Danio rerio]
MKVLFSLFLLLFLTLHENGVSGVGKDDVSVSRGDSVTLHTGVKTNQQYIIVWLYEGIRIAVIRGDLSYICTDVQCNNGTERFRDRLKLDHLTGSLTVMNTRLRDAGEYQLLISSSKSINEMIFRVVVKDVYWVDEDDNDEESVSVIEGDSVTLHTGVKTDQQDRIVWFNEGSRVAVISGDLNVICTDVQCDNSTTRFKNRLNLDHQTGSLTIMNSRNTDAGEYQLLIFSSFRLSKKIFRVVVHDVHWVQEVKVEVSVTDGYSVTLNTDTTTKQLHKIKWYFNNICVAQIRGDLSYICTDVQCDEGAERFGDRLKLDHQTGSLTIMNIRNRDRGEYKLEIISNRGSRRKIFRVLVDDSGPFSAAVPRLYEIVAIAAAVLLLAAAVSGVICCYKSKANGKIRLQEAAE